MIASYVVLAPYDNEQSDMLHKLDLDASMKKVPLHQCVHRASSLPPRRSETKLTPSPLPCPQRPAQVVHDARAQAVAGDRDPVRADAAPVDRL